LTFAGAWAGISRTAAGEVIRELRSLGFMEAVDYIGSGSRKTPLYLPGHGRVTDAGRRG
jgi:hypothetical protein